MGIYQGVMDIGTNSCRLVIVEKTETGDFTHVRQARITKLGEGLGRGRLHLSRQAMDRTLAVLGEYKDILSGYPVDQVWLLGTQALREADNSASFATEVKEKTGFDLRIISGPQEACLSYLGAAGGLKDPALAHPLVLDIGAGSTELMWLEPGAGAEGLVRAVSAPVGSLRLLERPLDDPAILAALAAGWQGIQVPDQAPAGGREALPSGGGTGPLVAVGGTATTLGAIRLKMKEYDPEALLGLRLSRRQVEETLSLLASLSPAARLALPGMLPGREEVLPWGLRILLGAMTYCRRDSVVICDRDLLYGVLA
jgi:exopolyphosphatase/guanosine-5'-triphosphate,3'-diphosphate pyrophosphatase